MRAFWTLVHRYAGLLTAAFLFVSGLTGAVISWDHELDDLLNPHLMEAHTPGRAQPALLLAQQVEARYPQVRVSYVPLHAEEGRSLALGVAPRYDADAKAMTEPGFNQVFLDPVTGAELGKREWGAVWPISRETFVSFLYRLHYTLHIPEMWGIDRWGIWLLGVIAMIWTVDCFVGFYLTLPLRRRQAAQGGAGGKSWWGRWKPAWKVRWSGGSSKLNFDLHRAFSLWTWALLLVLAFTAFSLNLYSEIFYPVMKTVSEVTPTPFDTRPMKLGADVINPRVGFNEVVATASREAARRNWEAPAGGVFYSQEYGIYMVSFFEPGNDHGTGGVGPPVLYYDGVDGRLLGERQPWKGSAADIFVQAQFPLHSGRILGIPGRILISFMGVVVAMLSVTGVVIWWRKRSSRRVAKTLRADELQEA
ncbi:PepSY domain-containing protein [Massilia sp. IC2-477]|uniref:PepSY-associated TM helix domain-containing protein n=1 Tax=Massilia sp. IC2-477 TaxID=2887198 RepID=UPI001D1189D9|nr:PepSY-associated TM helix domain-containing protein [Massilia sp. IC2-477]MCC2956694.1 PepSY domain-containing protein [Massilia sp. IC2-477]